MIGLDIPLHVLRGRCPNCKERISQALIESTIEGKYQRHWLRVDNVYGVGDEDEILAGFTEHRCLREAVSA